MCDRARVFRSLLEWRPDRAAVSIDVAPQILRQAQDDNSGRASKLGSVPVRPQQAASLPRSRAILTRPQHAAALQEPGAVYKGRRLCPFSALVSLDHDARRSASRNRKGPADRLAAGRGDCRCLPRLHASQARRQDGRARRRQLLRHDRRRLWRGRGLAGGDERHRVRQAEARHSSTSPSRPRAKTRSAAASWKSSWSASSRHTGRRADRRTGIRAAVSP